jgi:hypothetical protein
MKLLNVLEVTDILRCSRKTLQSKPWRQRMGLPVVRIGTRTLFKEEDVASSNRAERFSPRKRKAGAMRLERQQQQGHHDARGTNQQRIMA